MHRSLCRGQGISCPARTRIRAPQRQRQLDAARGTPGTTGVGPYARARDTRPDQAARALTGGGSKGLTL
jgi:hypothetical protein